MSTPIVTETPLRSEPVARDTFIDDVKRAAAASYPRPSAGPGAP